MNRNTPREDAVAAIDARHQRLLAVALAAALTPGGAVELYHNGQYVDLSPNIIPAAWRSKILRAAYQGGAQTTSFYVAPYINEVDVEALDSLTALNFESTLDEFTAYDELTRPLWEQDTEAAQEIVNGTTLAKITVNAAGTIWGIALMTVAAKGSTAGDLCAATTFASGRPVQVGDTLEFRYKMKASLPG